VTLAFSAGTGFDTFAFGEHALRINITKIENRASSRIALLGFIALPPKWNFLLADISDKARDRVYNTPGAKTIFSRNKGPVELAFLS
jgi:hypothetical protein